MLDTITLRIKESDFEIFDPDRFTPSAKGIISPPFYSFGKNGYISCYQNATKAEKKVNLYFPKLTLIRSLKLGGYSVYLRVEFSAPKLIFNNNFHELENHDFQSVVDKLAEKLHLMGVIVQPAKIRIAEVVSIHYSKNTILPGYSTASMIISEIQKVDLSQKLDQSRTVYRNGGHALHYHCNTYEIVFYDKLQDLAQAQISEKRAIEEDNYLQKEIASKWCMEKGTEVLRTEIRLNGTRIIGSMLQKVDYTEALAFDKLFSLNLSKRLICYFWDRIMKELRLIAIDQNGLEYLFVIIREQQPLLTETKVLHLASSMSIIQNVGVKGFRRLLGKNSSRKWSSLKKEMGKLNLPRNQILRTIMEFDKLLRAFIPLN